MDLYRGAPRDLGIPLDSWRPGQPETIIKILTTPKKYVLLEAPTGSGKSAIALGTAAMLARDGGTSYILTATKDLQDQYIDLGKDIGAAKVMGRSNFACEIDHSVTAAQGICTSGEPCVYQGTHEKAIWGCGYYNQLKTALAGSISVFNMAYFIAEHQYAYRFKEAELLIIDEAHAVRDQITDAITVELRKSTFDRAEVPWPGNHGNLGAWLAWAIQNEGPIEVKLNHLRDLDSQLPEDRLRYRALSSLFRSIQRILMPAQYVLKSMSQEHIQFVPVWPAPFANQVLFNAAKKVVFMTATPGDPKTFAAALGIDFLDMEVVRLSSTFHPSRRPLNYWPQGKIEGNNPLSWTGLGPSIAHILDQNPSQKGLICCVSYKLGAYLAQTLRQKFGSRILFPDSTTKKADLERFRTSSEPLVMISPSMSTGVDLPFDQCRFVVIPKLPFGDRSDPVLVARSASKLGKSLGLQDTANNLVQAYGRAMRAEDDWGVTWLLDGNYEWFRHSARFDLPRWFMEAVRLYDPTPRPSQNEWSGTGDDIPKSAEPIRTAVAAGP